MDWTTNRPTIRWLHGRITEVTRQYAMPYDYEVIKREVWHVEHLTEFKGTPGEALEMVRTWCEKKYKESGMEQNKLNV